MQQVNYVQWLITERGLKQCPSCDSHNGLRHVLATGKHYAKIVCDNCNERFVAWGAKPDTAKSVRPAAHKNLVKKYQAATGQDYCEICLRTPDDFLTNETLEAHHVIEYQDGGTDNLDNIRLYCTKHHRLVHHERTYSGVAASVRQPAEGDPPW